MKVSRHPKYISGREVSHFNSHIMSTQMETRLGTPFSQRQAPAVSDLARISFTILSWNIDFMRIIPDKRMTAAMERLHTHVKDEAGSPDSKSDAPVKTDNVIMLMR